MDLELTDLRAGQQAVERTLTGLSAVAARSRPMDGGWNAREIAYHLVDIERWYIAKLCEAVTNDPAAALDRFVAIWSDLRRQTLALAEAIPPERLDQAGLLSGVPEWTPRSLLTAIADHDQEHAAQAVAAKRGDNMIVHITREQQWRAAEAAGTYQGDTLATEGFIHCSSPHQVTGVANRRFQGQTDLVLLVIEPDRLTAPLRYEPGEDGELFPHIHGPLNLAAVDRVTPFPPLPDGTFVLPADIPAQ